MTVSSVLFHYTSTAGWEKIHRSGFIDATSLGAHRPDNASRHVWLTDGDREATGLRNSGRSIVRISVAPVPSVLYWPLWRELCDNRKAVEDAGGDPVTWYLSDQPLAMDHWGEVTHMDTLDVLHTRDAAASPLSRWGTMPTPKRINAAEQRLDLLRPSDALRAIHIDRQISALRALTDSGESEQRKRAAWRTLKADIAAFPQQPPPGLERQ
ncbi:hypothetical protein [Streptomyces melanogenes]|uniref:hypothetical protein n=1 Tax=Streptomyces melanogenes TaxID=67326 RepID=UPI00167EF007|nr:hypothetical protein [Streptomyces melanogenes]